MDAWHTDVEPPPPFDVFGPALGSGPLLIASPHSGSCYDPEFLAASRLDPLAIRRSEDCFVDELFSSGPALGIPLLAARFPRAFCDVNRERWELDPGMFEDELPGWCNTSSLRAQAGFGTLARVVARGMPIYGRKLRFADAVTRVERLWEPYHAVLGHLIDNTARAFGVCVLLDCHSMPTERRSTSERFDVVLGDRHGSSCAPGITALIEQGLVALGLTVRRNEPYAGGYVTRHYGRPGQGVHVLQIEIARALYMDEERCERLAGFNALRDAIGGMLASLAGAVARAVDGMRMEAQPGAKKMAVPKHRQV